MKNTIISLVIGIALVGSVGSLTARAQSPTTAPSVEGPPKLVVDAPLADLLAKALVVIQYRTENVRILPVYGPAAAAISPRIGHLHVAVDDTPVVWGNTSGEPISINGLPSGPHKIVIALTDANHKILTQSEVKFDVPRRPVAQTVPLSPKPAATNQPPAKIIIDPLQPEQLAKGLLYLRYRTENLQIAPVFGPAALAITPRVGHLHVTLDDAPWYWTYASGQPVIVNGLSPGSHKIRLEMVDANHQSVGQSVVEFEVPRR